jgi:hypothetical protein
LKPDKRIVGIDPGVRDLITCYSEFNETKKIKKIHDKIFTITLKHDKVVQLRGKYRYAQIDGEWYIYKFQKGSKTSGVSDKEIVYVNKRNKKRPRYDIYVVMNEYAGMIEKIEMVMSTEKDETGSFFRYSSKQRKHELKTKQYSIRRETEKKEELPEEFCGLKSIKEIETFLADYSLKPIDLPTFSYNLTVRLSMMNDFLLKEYEKVLYRKLKLSSYINKQKSESKMLKKFKEKIGSPEETLIIIGDYDANLGDRKHKGPVKSVGIKRLFNSKGYKLLEIDEYCTSKYCNRCKHELEHFKETKIETKKGPKKVEKWGIKRCTNSECVLITYENQNSPDWSRYRNRDKNAAKNILEIGKDILSGKDRKIPFTRLASIQVAREIRQVS